jgi:hypothetical protein
MEGLGDSNTRTTRLHSMFQYILEGMMQVSSWQAQNGLVCLEDKRLGTGV